MNLRDSSKKGYISNDSIEHINAGSLQRIADAMEIVANSYVDLLRRIKILESDRDYWRQACQKQIRKNTSLRGYVTSLKRKVMR